MKGVGFLRATGQGMRALENLKHREGLICFNVTWRVDFNGTREEVGIPVRHAHNSSLKQGNAKSGRTTPS